MTAESKPALTDRSRALRTILVGGLLAGVLDITAAFITGRMRGVGPVRILHAIASGILGADSYKGGAKTAALGLALHFLIALSACAVFYAASRKLDFLLRHAIVCGLLFGIAVYFFMNLVVLPLSAITFKVSFALVPLVTGLCVHMLCIGLPISLVVRRYSRWKRVS